jgi:8-oxo-dGTP pyrophosphatase MutT (NUDIX family)
MKIAGCFLEHDGKFLILLRQSHKPHGKTWGLPAGKIEAGETEQDTAMREVREETGYTLKQSELVHIGDFTFGPVAEQYHMTVYRVSLPHVFDIVLDSNAHSDHRWVTPEECYALPNLIPDFHELLRLVGYIKR